MIVGAGYAGDNLFADSEGVFGLAHLIYERKLNLRDSLALTLDWVRYSRLVKATS